MFASLLTLASIFASVMLFSQGQIFLGLAVFLSGAIAGGALAMAGTVSNMVAADAKQQEVKNDTI